jgi:LysR family glycine cleavage system transcriptional activator
MRNRLPPLNALRVFEVAARSESYSAAARELSLTHGAVSRQINILEDWLGQPLFAREGQSMMASPHARALAREISVAFDQIADAAERYGKERHVKVIRVSAPTTVAMRWLVPRLQDFAKICRDVDVRVSTVTSTESLLRRDFDVAIYRQAAPGGEYLTTYRQVPPGGQFQSWPLFQEYNTVIASPRLTAHTGITEVEQLASMTWLTSETRPGDWETWIEAAGQPSLRASRILRFDHFFVVMHAVADDQGFGIGPFPTLNADLAAGRVQTPFPALRSKGATYHALVPLDADKPVHVRDFIDWLRSSSAEDSEL